VHRSRRESLSRRSGMWGYLAEIPPSDERHHDDEQCRYTYCRPDPTVGAVDAKDLSDGGDEQEHRRFASRASTARLGTNEPYPSEPFHTPGCGVTAHSSCGRGQRVPLWNRLVGWCTGSVQSRPKLPQGWSYPIKASEVETLFPGVEYISWGWGTSRLRKWSPEERPSVFLWWHPHTAMPPSRMSFAAVPSENRASIREWIEVMVAPEARVWLDALATRSPVWLDGKHSVTWSWNSHGVED